MNSIREKTIIELGQHFELSIIGHISMQELEDACRKAIAYNLAGVYCANYQLPDVIQHLRGSDLFVGTAASFPGGSESPKVKATIVDEAVNNGAKAIDFVMNYRALMNGRTSVVENEVKEVRKAAPSDIELKMIIECCNLTDEQIKTACKIAIEHKIDYVKSSTGQLQGPSFEQVCLILDELKGTGVHSKVAGVKFPRPQNAMVFLIAGIDRIGSQQCFEILDGVKILRQRGIF